MCFVLLQFSHIFYVEQPYEQQNLYTKLVSKLLYLIKLCFTSNIFILFICYIATTEETGKQDDTTFTSSKNTYISILYNVLLN